MKKQPEVTEQTKKNIMDAFWMLYLQKRIDKITVKEIMDRAGYNRGTFYVYYNDVYDVLAQLEKKILPAPTLSLDEAIKSHAHAGNDIRATLDGFIRLYEQHGEYYSVLLSENGDPYFSFQFKQWLRPVLELFLQGNGIPMDTEKIYAIEYMTSALMGILTLWFARKKDLSIERLMDMINELSTKGPLQVLLMG